MFQKPFRVKSNTKLKNSERKRIKILLLKEFASLDSDDVDNLIPQGKAFSLLKLVTHAGNIIALYMVDKTPLLFEYNSKLYPSVYMLWEIPYLLPDLTIWPQLQEKIVNGADLMLPGVVVKGPLRPFCYGCFAQGAAVAINTTKNKAPLAVGIAALSSCDMFMSAQKGKAVKVFHTFGDKLWELGGKIEIPELGPPDDYDESEASATVTETEMPVVCERSVSEENKLKHLESVGVDSISIASTELPDTKLADISGLETEITCYGKSEKEILTDITISKMEKMVLSDYNIIQESSSCTEHEKEKESTTLIEDGSTKTAEEIVEMDKLLEYCFLKALKVSVRRVDLPLLTSNFYKLHMIPSCPLGSQVDIKKSSFKKLSKFLNSMEEKGVVKVKEITKGVESIISFDQSHEMLRDFVDLEGSPVSKSSTSATKTMITELYTITAAVLPVLSIFGFRKGDMISLVDLRKYITDYVKKEKLQDPLVKRFVNINDALQQIVQDRNTISLTWEDLVELFISHMSRGYQMNLPGEKSSSHKGKLEPIDIQIGRRTGNKKVTLINNLELYGIDITQFARECQHGVAASTSISTVAGKKSQQLLVQGNQVIFVGNLLTSKYQIPKRYIRGLENAPRQKK